MQGMRYVWQQQIQRVRREQVTIAHGRVKLFLEAALPKLLLQQLRFTRIPSPNAMHKLVDAILQDKDMLRPDSRVILYELRGP
tara:strand:+ start:317 stop:565 length:249 start_codon:yes stop_codon:yes gene_type:complete